MLWCVPRVHSFNMSVKLLAFFAFAAVVYLAVSERCPCPRVFANVSDLSDKVVVENDWTTGDSS